MQLILGAALTLLATLIVQWFVVPWVEARKRREERWERYVLELGELVSFQLPMAAQAYLDFLLHHAVIAPGLDAERDDDRFLEERQPVLSERLQMMQRFAWLANRVEGYDRYAENLKFFVWARRDFDEAMTNTVRMLALRPSLDELMSRMEVERIQQRNIAVTVSALAEMRRPPRRSLRLRMRQWKHAIGWYARHGWAAARYRLNRGKAGPGSPDQA